MPGQVEAVAVRGARRGVLRADLRQPRPDRGAARAATRGRPAAAGALPRRRDGTVRRGPHPRRRPGAHAAVELEGGRRQLPRGLPRPGRAPGADAAARLQALLGRDHGRLRRLRRAAAGEGIGQLGRAAVPAAGPPDARADRRGRPHLPLHRDLPEHRDRPLSRPRADLEDEPARRRPSRRAGHLPAAQGLRPAHPHRAEAQPLRQPDHHPRGRRPGRSGCRSGLGNTDFSPARCRCARRAWPGSPLASAPTSATWTRSWTDDAPPSQPDAPAPTSPPRPGRRSSTPPAR